MSGRGVGPKHEGGGAPKSKRDAQTRGRLFGRAARSLILTALFACAFLVLFASSTRLSADYADGVRTEGTRTLQDAERVWRRAAWQQDDYLSQVRLGDLYSQNQSFPQGETPSNKSFDDPVESYVWYFLALRRGHSYAGTNGDAASVLATIRNNALNNIERIYSALSFDQRLDARGRIIYILASRGADGFMALGRLHRASAPVPFCSSHPTDPTCTVIGGGNRTCACRMSNFVVTHSWLGDVLYNPVTRAIYSIFGDPRTPVCAWKSDQDLHDQDPNDRNPYLRIDDFNAGSPYPAQMCPADTSASAYTYGSTSSTGYSSTGTSGYGGTNPAMSSPSVSISPQGGSDTGAVSMSPTDNGVGGGGYAGSGGYSSTGGSYSGGGYGSGDDADTPDDGGAGYSSSSYNSPGGSYYGGSGYSSSSGGGGYGGGAYGGSSYGGYPMRRPPSVFTRSDAEALMYFKVAERLRHPLAPMYVGTLTQAIKYNFQDAQKIVQDSEDRARNWAPPFEYYPGSIAGGSIHSDESPIQLEQQIALQRVGEIPYPLVEKILAARLFVPRLPCAGRPFCPNPAVAKFQDALGDPPTGVFTPQQIVRLIQMSAVDGRSEAQNTLGIMYVKGIGVPRNYQRAEQWFIRAARQQNIEAYCNLTLLYQRAPQGIEVDDNKIARFQIEKQRILQYRGQWGVLRDEDIIAASIPDVSKNNVPGQPDGAKR
jgi:TPR repeat protein